MKTFKCYLRVCALCASGWGQRDLLCDACWEILWHQERFFRGFFVTPEFPVSAMWTWSKSSKAIECLVRSQKFTGLTLARERIFRRYLTYSLGPPPTQIVYVIPKNKTCDHASEGAHVLAKYLGVEATALKIEPRAHYKSKGRRERGQAQRITQSLSVRRSERVWFYDDVITTGSTARAVWAVLGKPQGFQAVALVYRESCLMALKE